MIEYKKKKAVFIKAMRNEFNHSKFFIIVEDAKGIQYQIKFNEVGQRHNINEFIAHYIGTSMGAPMLGCAFLKLEEGEMLRVKERIKSQVLNLNEVDIWDQDDGTFFGVVWEQHTVSITREDELMDRVSASTNSKSFYSLYSMDQFFKNYDRHIKNHLVVKKGAHTKYYLIDHDRLFGSTNWASIPHYIDDFNPLIDHPRNSRPYHVFLIWIINDVNISYVHHYAGKIARITDDDIKDMCDTIIQVYALNNADIGMIESWAKHRKDQIVMKCFEHESILPNVKRKGIYSVS